MNDEIMWAPTSMELNKWAEVLGDDIKKSNWTDFTFGNQYILRDEFRVVEGGSSGNIYYYKSVNGSTGLIDWYNSVESVILDYGYSVNIRPVCRIAQLDYKGF